VVLAAAVIILAAVAVLVVLEADLTMKLLLV
jgi:hypothetical protein